MPRVKLEELSNILNKNVYVDSDMPAMRETNEEIIFGKSFLHGNNSYGQGGEEKRLILDKILECQMNGYHAHSSREKKALLLKTFQTDAEGIPELFKEIRQNLLKQAQSERLLPVLNEKMIYKLSSKEIRKSYQELANYLKHSPNNDIAQKMKKMLMDEEGKPRVIFAESEFGSIKERQTAKDLKQVIQDIFTGRDGLEEKLKQIYTVERNESLQHCIESIIDKMKNSTVKNEQIFSVMAIDPESTHHTSMTIVKMKDVVKIYGTDSVAGDETFDRMFSRAVKAIKEKNDSTGIRVEYAYARNYMQKINGVCGIYSMLNVMEIQMRDPKEITKKIDQAIQFDKNEQYLAEKMLRILLKLKNNEIAGDKRVHLEKKLTECGVYLSAMKYILENPLHRTIERKKIEELLQKAPLNLETVFYRDRLISRTKENEALYRYANKNYDKVFDILNQHKEGILAGIISDKQKLNQVADIITGHSELNQFTNFKKDSEVTKLETRVALKREKMMKAFNRLEMR